MVYHKDVEFIEEEDSVEAAKISWKRMVDVWNNN